jgi:allene oxide cyclase
MKLNLAMPLFFAGAVILAGAATFQGNSPRTLHVVERAETDIVTDTGEEGDSVGDILTFANEVFDENNETQVGTNNGYCVRTVVGAAWECFWTLILEDGQITVEGPFYDAADSVLAITGGTGAYIAARGQMALSAYNEDATAFNFVYEITN